MKKFLKTAGLPIGVFALAISAAFATNAMNNSTTRLASDYYYQELNESNCILIPETLDCSEFYSGPVCTWEDTSNAIHNVFAMEKDNNQVETCTKALYRPF